MTSVIDDIVNVTITRQSAGVSRAGFGVPLFVSDHLIGTARVQFFSGPSILTDMVTAGHTTTSPAYLQVQGALSQEPSVSRVAIGRREAKIDDITFAGTWADSDTFTLTIGGVPLNITIDSTPANFEAARDEVLGKLNSNATFTQNYRAESSGTAVLRVIQNTGSTITLAASETTAGDGTASLANFQAGDGGWEATMNAIQTENGEWYGFSTTTRDETDILALASWTESQIHVYSALTYDTAVRDGTGGNVSEDLQGFSYRRTWITWESGDAETYTDARELGNLLVANLDAVNGSKDLAFKTITGSAPQTLTGAQRTVIHGLQTNTIETRLGRTFMFPGNMVGGSTGAPVTIFSTVTIDWLDQRMTEDIFAWLSSSPTKRIYDQAGLDAIEGIVRARLAIAAANGHILGNYTVNVPPFEEQQASNISAGIVANVTFQAQLANAIRQVLVNGNVTV